MKKVNIYRLFEDFDLENWNASNNIDDDLTYKIKNRIADPDTYKFGQGLYNFFTVFKKFLIEENMHIPGKGYSNALSYNEIENIMNNYYKLFYKHVIKIFSIPEDYIDKGHTERIFKNNLYYTIFHINFYPFPKSHSNHTNSISCWQVNLEFSKQSPNPLYIKFGFSGIYSMKVDSKLTSLIEFPISLNIEFSDFYQKYKNEFQWIVKKIEEWKSLDTYKQRNSVFESFSPEGWDSNDDDYLTSSITTVIKTNLSDYSDKAFTLRYDIPARNINRIKIFNVKTFEKLNGNARWEVVINNNWFIELDNNGYYILSEDDKLKGYLRVYLYFPEWGVDEKLTNLSQLFIGCYQLSDVISIPNNWDFITRAVAFFGESLYRKNYKNGKRVALREYLKQVNAAPAVISYIMASLEA